VWKSIANYSGSCASDNADKSDLVDGARDVGRRKLCEESGTRAILIEIVGLCMRNRVEKGDLRFLSPMDFRAVT